MGSAGRTSGGGPGKRPGQPGARAASGRPRPTTARPPVAPVPGRVPPDGSKRPDPAVYRRRRIVVGTLALAVLIAIVLGVTSLVGGGGAGTGDAPNAMAAAPTSTRTATATPTPVPTVTVGFEPTDCVPGVLEVIGAGSAEAYPAGSSIAFSLTVTNVGPVPCLVDGGTANLGVVVTSGEDRVWASTDCPAGEAERPLLLDAGAVERVAVRWDQVRSAPGCPGGQPSALPGTYRAVGTLDGGQTAAPGWETIFLIQ